MANECAIRAVDALTTAAKAWTSRSALVIFQTQGVGAAHPTRFIDDRSLSNKQTQRAPFS
jgi:hypothetical protein